MFVCCCLCCQAETARVVEGHEREKAAAVAGRMAAERALEAERGAASTRVEELAATAAAATATRDADAQAIADMTAELYALRSSSQLGQNEQLQELLKTSREAASLRAQVARFVRIITNF